MSLSSWASRHIAFPLWAWKDGSRVQAYLAEAERHQHLDPEVLDSLQWERTITLLTHAQQTVPYYTRLFRELDLAPSELRGWSDFSALPPLTREIIQREGSDLHTTALPAGDRFVTNSSGGTTGQPVQFLCSRVRMEQRRASTIRHDRWTGWELGEPMAVLWNAPRDLLQAKGLRPRLRNAALERLIVLDASRLDRPRMLEFVERVRKRRPRTWLAYAGSLALFTRFLEENGIDDLEADAVISSAEVLAPGERERVQRVLGAQVFDRYGGREVSIIASECGQSPDHTLHLNADALKIEIEGDAEGRGPILITDLLNQAMPFVRYRIGDVSSLHPGPCPCGRGLPLIHSIDGREGDFIVTADGRIVSGIVLVVMVLGPLEAVQKAQLVQERRGEVRVRFVTTDSLLKRAEEEILEGCATWLGKDTKLELERVDDIPMTASGKFPFTVSSVDPFEVLG